ncbi:MAG: RluA family pseudouridine synthase [Pseudomonadota bacterium]
MTGPRTVTVGPNEAEQRLDRWLRRQIPGLAQGQIEKMCRKGQIRVDGGRVRANTRVAPGQAIKLPHLEESRTPPQSAAPAGQPELKLPAGLVLHRDADILVLDKPAGLAVQGGSKLSKHLGSLLPLLRFGADQDPKLVHRLDRDTSGVLVLAMHGRAATDLARQFSGRSVKKTYLALVAGKPDPQQGTIRYGLVKAGGQGEERMHPVHPDDIAATPGAQRATTDYAVIEQLANRLAVVALRPVTGRTHQLRAHMAAIGGPIAGEGKYARRPGENLGDGWGAGLGGGLSRQLHLHACRLAFNHPKTGKPFVASAPMPAHFRQTWKVMGLQPLDAGDDPFSDFPN